jgi:hypothetical protein
MTTAVLKQRLLPTDLVAKLNNITPGTADAQLGTIINDLINDYNALVAWLATQTTLTGYATIAATAATPALTKR